MIANEDKEAFVSQILVRHLSKKVVARLKERAQRDKRSLQAEVKSILEQAVNEAKVDMKTARKLSEQFRMRFKKGHFPNSTQLIREDRDR